ncbi:ABC transporter permease [Paenibacillus sp. FSL H8-0034]|uniref:ABC transporter permease n=1 Tax=Paenibacillus sp. FSL H8-0034 TaxID=2954671 RepID=UPI0030F8FA8E
MTRYLLNRFVVLILTLLLFTLFVFTLMHMAPGDPAALFLQDLGAAPDKTLIAALQQKWGLDQSFAVQYFRWLYELVQGKLGNSYISSIPVTEEIVTRLEPTIRLMLSSFVVTLFISVPLGIHIGLREHSLLDRVTYAGTVLGLSIPLYWLAILLMFGFGVMWKLFPIVGSGSLRHYVLPVTAISIVESVYFIRMIRSLTLEYKRAFYMEAAAARGLKRRILYPSYLFRSMLVPIMTIIGSSFPSFFGAAIIIENMFSFPGIGTYMLDMIYRRDFPAIQGCTLLLATAIFILNFCTDLCYYWADPRIQLEKQRWEN